ncbi:hypothetical protein ACLB2K_002318 [Fragaria x ananassa]
MASLMCWEVGAHWFGEEGEGGGEVARVAEAVENDMVDEVNKRNDAFKEQHPDATEEQIMESVQSQQIEVLGRVLKTRKGKEIRGMGRGGERDLSHSSNGSTSRSRPPRVDEQQLQEVQQRYEQRLKSQVAALYEHLGMPPPPPPQFPPPPPDVSPPPHVSPQNNDDLDDNIELDNGRP